MTLIEMMVAAGITGVIVVSAMQVEKQIKGTINQYIERSDVLMDESTAKRLIISDLWYASESFSFVKNPKNPKIDDGENFWVVSRDNKSNEPSKQYTLDEPESCFNILTYDISHFLKNGVVSKKKSFFLSPAAFYMPRTTTSDPLVFASKQEIGLLSANFATEQYVKLSSTDPVLVGDIYREYSRVFKVGGNYQLINLSENEILKLKPFNFLDLPPSSCPPIETVDDFLRCLPAPGGGVSNFYLSPVRFISYCLRTQPEIKGLSLYRTVNGRESLIAQRIDKIVFSRKKDEYRCDVNFFFCKVMQKNGNCVRK